MKRKTDHTSWRSKLSAEGVKYLDTYRAEKLKAREEQKNQGDINLLDHLAKVSAQISPEPEPDPKLKEFWEQNPGAATQYQKIMAEMMGPIPPPATKDLWTAIYTALEQGGSDGRLALSMMLAFGARGMWEMYYEVRKRHFGNSPINNQQFFWIAGTALQNYGKILRTGKFDLTTKGRVNVELIDLIKEIRQYQLGKLEYRELRDALEYVFVYTPSEEWLRLYVHRARRKGWL